jgi:RHS repeat-associated protein
MSVFATGTPQLTYQWNYNGTLIPGATSKMYIINDVQANQAGNYSVLVTNALGSVLSQTAVLTVTSPPSCTAPPGNMTNWWRAEGNATDSAGTNSGIMVGGATFGTGKVGQGFSFSGATTCYVQVADSPSLRFTNAVTAELWYKDTGSSNLYALFAKSAGLAPWPSPFGARVFPNECVQIYFADPTYGVQGFNYSPVPAVGMFHHLAVTYQQTDANHVAGDLYIDGNCVCVGSFVGALTNTFSAAPLTIGNICTNGSEPFTGIVDELTLYNRALSASEILAIYNAGASGKCTTTSYGAVGVTITSPTNLQSFTAVASNVPLQATVSDNLGGSVTNVQFFFGPVSSTNLIATTTTASSTNANVYNLTWSTNLWVGNYPITAVAKDNKGGTNASQVVLFKVNPTNGFPFVTITTPTNGAVFQAGVNLTISAIANGSNGVPITNVEFFQNSIPLGSDQIAPYQIDSLGLVPGTYTFSALATDSNGLQRLSQPVTVSVQGWLPLSLQGYWDPAFLATNWDYTVENVNEPYLVIYGSSNEVFVAHKTSESAGVVHLWNSCGWTIPPGLDSVYTVDSVLYRSSTLFLGGNMTESGGPFYVQSYNGSALSDLSSPQLGSQVNALALVKGELMAGGVFANAGKQYVAKLVGTNWVQVGDTFSGYIHAIASIGDNLYVGGEFTNASGNPTAGFVAQLSGTNWIPLGQGINGTVRALAVWNNQLLVGGEFTQAGGNTNISHLAKWDGTTWSSLGGTISSSQTMTTPYVAPSIVTMVVHGNDVFVGGVFDTVSMPSAAIQAANIAHLQWNPISAHWSWYAMDQGLLSANTDFNSAWVDSLAFYQPPSTNYQELIAGGHFGMAGSMPSYRVARWVIGTNQCANAYLPTVYFNKPTSSDTIAPNSPIQLIATAVPAGSSISNVVFYADTTNSIGIGTPGTNNSYNATWTNGYASGVHRFDAVATSTNGPFNKATVFVSITPSSGPGLHSTQYTLPANAPPTPLYVLTNATSAAGISSIFQGGSAAVGIAPGGTNLIYQPSPNTYGTNVFWYTATNSQGVAAQSYVTVIVVAPPLVQITQPLNQSSTNTPVTLTISGTAVGYNGTVTNIQIFTNGVQYASFAASGSTFSTNWTQTSAGFYTFVAIATDNFGSSSTSSPPTTIDVTTVSTNIHAPYADMFSPSNSLNTVGSLAYWAPYTVLNGQLTVTGNAYSPDAGASVVWQLILLDPSNPTNPPLYNITPGPLNAQGFHAGAVANASFGNCDLSLVQNGTYSLTLVVQSEGIQTSSDVTIQVASNLKIGQFSFSEQDLVIPVNGIPLTVIRTYNSLNPLSSDFGYGWTYSIDSMDVQLDDERTPVQIGVSPQALSAFPTEEDAYGAPLATSVRTGGGWDVTLNLPDGRRTTFLFSPRLTSDGSGNVYAQWTAPPDVHATLGAYSPGAADSGLIKAVSGLTLWADSVADSTFDNHDIPGFVLTNYDGTQYVITRGLLNQVYYTPDPSKSGSWANVYGPPKLTSIVQRTGDQIIITTNSIYHLNKGGTNTQTIWFERDNQNQNRITAIHDAISGSGGTPSVRYVYNDSGNLIQVLKLTDRNAGTYSTNRYIYGNGQFPHYITEIDNGIGVPITKNYYDSSGRLTSTVDANGNTTQYIHNLTNSLEITVDPRGNTNTLAYDSRGNAIAVTNAMGGITLASYDGANNRTNEVLFLNGARYATNNFTYDPNTGLLLAGVNALGSTNSFTYNSFGQVLTATDARGNTSTNLYDPNTGNLLTAFDAVGNPTTNFFDASSLLKGSQDAVGTLTTNFYDPNTGNLVASARLSTSGTILSTNSFGYDLNGNRTNSTVWRKVNGSWTGAATTFIYDGQNRAVQTIEPDGGTNAVIYDLAGRMQSKSDKLGHVTSYSYDFQGRLVQTTYPDLTTETSAYDSADNRTNSVDRAGRPTTYVFDGLNRQTQIVFADNTSNTTVYDDLGRVKFSVDARGTTNAFGYDLAGRRISLTNAWGTSIAMTNLYGLDSNGNPVYWTNSLGRVTTNVFDALNRQAQVLYPDGTVVSTGFDAVGRRVAETNQDGIVSRFGFDGIGRLLAVTNGFGAAQSTCAQYLYDEAGNQIAQIDALNRTNSFTYDGLGRRITHTMPGAQAESFSYDLAGNLTNYTSFSGAIITNQFDVLNRLTNRTSVNGYRASFVYSATGKRTSMTDASGTTSYAYDNRDRLVAKTNYLTGGPTLALNYGFDANGNLTNLWSANSIGASGVTNFYQFDALNRLTNVVANGSSAAGYGFDGDGNLQAIRYGNGVTNQFQYDVLDRLTNTIWKLNGSTPASFYYQLGAAGNRTNLTETLLTVITNRTYAWNYDSLYRLKQETISGGTGGTLSYGFDLVGNRTNRTITGGLSLTNQSFTFNTNDWQTSDSYDNNGNTTNSSGNSYQFDVLNHLTNANNSAVLIWYDGVGNRLKKTVGSTTTFYLVDDRNPSGYVQVVEEWTASGGTTNLSRVYNYGLQLISQRQPNTSTNYFIFDGHGSTRILTDNGGNVVNAFTFDAYGNLIASNTAPQTAYLFAGEQWDFDLGLYYNRARVYNQGIGRFITRDTVEGDQENPLSLHRYLVVADNPVNNVDPSGHGAEIDVSLAGALTAGLAAFTAASIYEAKTHAIGNILGAMYTAATTATIAVTAEEELVRPKSKAEFRRRVKEKTKNDGGSFIFLHGTSTGSFKDYASGKVDFTQGAGDFGAGFYTTIFPAGILDAGKYAIEREATDGGTAIVLIFVMPVSDFQTLRTKYMLPNRVAPRALYGVDCVYGPLGSGFQYKWEPGRGALQLVKGFRGVVPLPDLKNWKN